MKKELTRNLRLGIFVLAGTAFLIISLYMIGSKRNLFSDTISVKTNFRTVNGLMPGHNVRFSGIDVGTVDEVDILNDTSVTVTMIIENRYAKFIMKNSIAAIGTDGLMGNKLVNINSGTGRSTAVNDGDFIASIQPMETDEMFRTLSVTNENIRVITDDLKVITAKINNSNSLWGLLSDSTIADNVRNAIVNIRMTSDRSAIITGDLSAITSDIRNGKGNIGALITDTTLSGRIKQSVVSIQVVSDHIAMVSGDLGVLTARVKSGQGTIGTLMMDTTFVRNLNQSVINLNSGTKGFDDNMEALKHSFLLRRYFRKQNK